MDRVVNNVVTTFHHLIPHSLILADLNVQHFSVKYKLHVTMSMKCLLSLLLILTSVSSHITPTLLWVSQSAKSSILSAASSLQKLNKQCPTLSSKYLKYHDTDKSRVNWYIVMSLSGDLI